MILSLWKVQCITLRLAYVHASQVSVSNVSGVRVPCTAQITLQSGYQSLSTPSLRRWTNAVTDCSSNLHVERKRLEPGDASQNYFSDASTEFRTRTCAVVRRE